MTTPEKPKTILDFFPLSSPRVTQKLVLEEIDKVSREGKQVIILEGPVGSGKSAIAIALAEQEAAEASGVIYTLAEGETRPEACHILTPRKDLQDQYFHDFKDRVVLMKGRNAYPCIYDALPKKYIPILNAVREGRVKPPAFGEPNCVEAPCKDNPDEYVSCTRDHECPYTLAITIAQGQPIVVHNLHSFLYQTNFSTKFGKRRLLVIDEAHEVEGVVRDFATQKVFLRRVLTQEDIEQFKTIDQWATYLKQPELIPEETEHDRQRKQLDPKFESAKDAYLSKIQFLEAKKEGLEHGFSVECEPHFSPIGSTQQTATTLVFIPHSIGYEVNKYILNHGHRVVLMSGTIYDKANFCRTLGIPPDKAHFIRIPSTFPTKNRPIYLKPEYQTELSHAKWDENFNEMLAIIKKTFAIFHDVKGLIHAPSYAKARMVVEALKDPRLISHDSKNFPFVLEQFFASKGNEVLISPICQQGVDFKEDRARFQLILTVPYASTGSKFVSDKMAKDFAWYNLQAAVTFGQQIGRINRSPEDFGVTFLVDSRFNKFMAKNSKLFPAWLKEACVYK